MFFSILTILMLALAVGFLGYVAYCYVTAPAMVLAKSTLNPNDTPEYRPARFMDRLAYATKKSSTLFVQYAAGAFVMLSNGIINMADLFGSTEARDFVTKNFTPEVASGLILALVAITIWARFRKE